MNENEKQELLQLTKTLIQLTNQAHHQFSNRTNETGYTPDFYREVKPFADHVLKTGEKWKTLAMKWIKEEDVQHLYPLQIENTFENVKIVSVTAFQKDTKTKRFYEMIQAIHFILKTMVEQIRTT